MNVHVKPHNETERDELRLLIRAQFVQLKGETMLTCADCKRTVPVRFAYHCYWCGLWFCHECAGVHFGAVGAFRLVPRLLWHVRKALRPC